MNHHDQKHHPPNQVTIAYPPIATAANPHADPSSLANYPAKDGEFDPPPDKTKSKGDGFWRGCCAGWCCYCCLDACF